MAIGCQGSYCTMCTISETDGKEVSRQGFTVNRCLSGTMDLFESLVQSDENGNEYVLRTAGDYQTRLGLTQKLFAATDLHQNFPIPHAYI